MPITDPSTVAVVNKPASELEELGLLTSAPKEAASESAKATPPKDPDTGRFISPKDVEPEVSQPTHPQELVDAAAYFGYSEDEMKDIPTQTLYKMVLRLQRVAEVTRREESRFRDREAATVRVKPEVAEPNPDDLGLGEVEGALYPELTALLKKQARKIAELEGGFKQVNDREVARAQSHVDEMVDEAFESLGDSYEKFFGKGGVSELEAGSAEIQRRLAVFKMANVDFSKLTPKQTKAKIKAIAETLYAPAVAAPAAPAKGGSVYEAGAAAAPTAAPAVNGNGKSRITPKQWEESATAIPQHRQIDELPNGDEKAVQNLAKKMAATSTHKEDEEIRAGLLK